MSMKKDRLRINYALQSRLGAGMSITHFHGLSTVVFKIIKVLHIMLLAREHLSRLASLVRDSKSFNIPIIIGLFYEYLK